MQWRSIFAIPKAGRVPERSNGADCKSAGVMPSEVRILPRPRFGGGSNSVGRVTAFQAVGRGFESRLPLNCRVCCAFGAGVAQW